MHESFHRLFNTLLSLVFKAHLGLRAGHDGEPAEQMHESHFHFQLGKPHAHAVTGTGPKRQVYKRMPTGLGLWCESRDSSHLLGLDDNATHSIVDLLLEEQAHTALG